MTIYHNVKAQTMQVTHTVSQIHAGGFMSCKYSRAFLGLLMAQLPISTRVATTTQKQIIAKRKSFINPPVRNLTPNG